MRRGEVRDDELGGWEAYEAFKAEEEARREQRLEEYLEAYGSYYSFFFDEGDR